MVICTLTKKGRDKMHRFKENRVMYQRMLFLMILDAMFTVLASFVAVFTRMEFKIDWLVWNNYLEIIGIDILITLLFIMYLGFIKVCGGMLLL